ncbi:unnamed protein product [Clonostachys rosea f. rosea IK726]|uniref:Uncharacterized protein n=2 Tax=Bionectria ochroleuca TaxID=29856 RepID=A0A0B7JHG9_BIOOC|nr:unnamed protein product [Clonostachys rosea f. rosea IK726]
MGRRLPWKRTEVPSVVKSATPKSSPKPASPIKRAPPPSTRSERAQERALVQLSEPGNRLRSPSTSPPPEPPQEEFMIAGPFNDDRYRMVDDELLGVAQRFTVHLHRAEYQRLKTQAKTQNAATIREIERPTVGTPTKVSKQRSEALKRASRQRSLLGNDHGRDLPWMGTSLQGLMEAPRRDARVIRSLPQAASGTRAAAGFSSQLSSSPNRENRPAGDSPLQRREASALRDSRGIGARATPQGTGSVKSKRVANTNKSSSPSMGSSASVGTPSRRPLSTVRPSFSTPQATKDIRQDEVTEHDEDDDDDIFGLNKRRMRREKSRENIRRSTEKPMRKPSPNAIPSFL